MIILDMEYIPLETVVVALELISAAKRSPSSYTPKGNTEPPRRYVVPSKRIPEQIINGRTWACLSRTQKQYGLTMKFGLSFGY